MTQPLCAYEGCGRVQDSTAHSYQDYMPESVINHEFQPQSTVESAPVKECAYCDATEMLTVIGPGRYACPEHRVKGLSDTKPVEASPSSGAGEVCACGHGHDEHCYSDGTLKPWCDTCPCKAYIPASTSPQGGGEPRFYVASRASIPERSEMWRKLRSDGWQITSSWIDEAGEGETEDFGELWQRIYREIADSDALILFATESDFPLKGALVEVGIALGMGKRVFACLPNVQLQGRTFRPIGSWIKHPLVTIADLHMSTICHLLSAYKTGEQGAVPGPQEVKSKRRLRNEVRYLNERIEVLIAEIKVARAPEHMRSTATPEPLDYPLAEVPHDKWGANKTAQMKLWMRWLDEVADELQRMHLSHEVGSPMRINLMSMACKLRQINIDMSLATPEPHSPPKLMVLNGEIHEYSPDCRGVCSEYKPTGCTPAEGPRKDIEHIREVMEGVEVTEEQLRELRGAEPSATSTDERLAEIAKRESKATKGPWKTHQFEKKGERLFHLDAAGEKPLATLYWDNAVWLKEGEAEANAEFIKHARADIPYLLRLVAELRPKANRTDEAERDARIWERGFNSLNLQLAELRRELAQEKFNVQSEIAIKQDYYNLYVAESARAEQAERERDEARECLLGAQQSSINNRVDSGKWETVARSVYAQYQNEQNCRVANQDSARRLESELATARQRIAVLEGGKNET